ncbi:5-methyltetrahydropteroyltriglutamate--homocysteine methyltransferase [Streptomyces laurentii]|uniref:5-methyltetrahydropteroyltriglutamate-- homocysteine methyltransferase n=1 Tax=Streptomyces laurentii TaxID=39478 RepID=UPI0036A9ABDE
MSIPTEPIGSVPRPAALHHARIQHANGRINDEELAEVQAQAVADTLDRLEKLGSPVLVDGDQAKPSAVTYPLDGFTGLAPDGVAVPYADGHVRTLPRLTAGPFRYGVRADAYLRTARQHTELPVKATVAAPSALSLLYPADGIDGYPRDTFLDDLLAESEAEIRACLDGGAHRVQLDFGEARLALKLDPSGGVLDEFVALNNRVLERFAEEERARIGVHTHPGADQGSTHSLDVDYTALLPRLFQLAAGSFFLQMASEPDPERVLAVVAGTLRPGSRVFVGVTDPLDSAVEPAERVRDRVLAAARHIPADRLGTCDDAGFAMYADDTALSRETAFAKIDARLRGTELAARELGL